MRNIPVFTTEYGVASLGLSSVQEDGKAYITVHDSENLTVFLRECADFCKAVGGRHIYATGKNVELPRVYATVISMTALLENFADTDACLMPVRPEDEGKWLKVYNDKMRNVPGAKYLRTPPEDAYFVHREDDFLGVGAASDDKISVVASCKRRQGAEIVRALCHALASDIVILEVAAENRKAVALYERMGFTATGIKEIWYEIL